LNDFDALIVGAADAEGSGVGGTNMAWTVDNSHSGIAFSVRHLVIAKVRGTFGRWNAKVDYDAANPLLTGIEAHIDAASIDTKEEKRDAHLRSADFLDAEKHKELVFTSREVTRSADGYIVAGDLEIRGVKKPVRLEVEALGSGKDPWGNERAAFTARTTINRKEWGLNWNQALEAGGFLVGDKIDIEIDLQLVKTA
jgi:polyisoprenoid-binding protein YceI